MSDFEIFVNFKTYLQATGENGIRLAQVCEQVRKEYKIKVTPIVQSVDLAPIVGSINIPVWLQHLDFQPQGKYTGWQNIEAALGRGAGGTLLNHSEHPLPPGTIKQILARIRTAVGKNGDFKTMLCGKTLGQLERLVKFKPDYVAYEISELIGGDISTVDYAPEPIKHAIGICEKIPLVVGAGISKPEDLVVAKKLGASGVLISSAVVLAENPKQTLIKLIKDL